MENPSPCKGVKAADGKGKFPPATSMEQLLGAIKGESDGGVSRVVLSNCFVKMPEVNTTIECSSTPQGPMARVIQSHRQPMERDIGIYTTSDSLAFILSI